MNEPVKKEVQGEILAKGRGISVTAHGKRRTFLYSKMETRGPSRRYFSLSEEGTPSKGSYTVTKKKGLDHPSSRGDRRGRSGTRKKQKQHSSSCHGERNKTRVG